eukprot:350843-Chlamydomonas_euryale.AAC.5
MHGSLHCASLAAHRHHSGRTPAVDNYDRELQGSWSYWAKEETLGVKEECACGGELGCEGGT